MDSVMKGILIWLLLLPLSSGAQSKGGVDETHEKLSKISAEITTIRNQLTKVQTNYSEEEKILGKLETEINTVHQKITETQHATRRAELELSTLETRVNTLSLNYARKLALLKEGLSFHYRHYEKNWAKRLEVQTPGYFTQYRKNINLAKLDYF
ncbi:MAG: hypothetical protein V4490_04500, partial [Pseudomonadota bacterium]